MNIFIYTTYKVKHPKEIILTEEQVDTLRSTLQTLKIDALLKTILTGLLDNHIWLQHELHEKKVKLGIPVRPIPRHQLRPPKDTQNRCGHLLIDAAIY